MISLFSVVYAVLSSLLFYYQRNLEKDQIGFSYNKVIKERKIYLVLLSLFEHRSVEQLLCDIGVFICNDYCRQNSSFQTSFVDILFFGCLVNVVYLYIMYVFDSNSDVRDIHFSGFYGLCTYKALGNSYTLFRSLLPLSLSTLVFLLNLAALVGLQLVYKQERQLILYSCLLLLCEPLILLLFSAYWRCILVGCIIFVSILNALDVLNNAVLPTTNNEEEPHFIQELHALHSLVCSLKHNTTKSPLMPQYPA